GQVVVNPQFNPYVTVDFMEGQPLNDSRNTQYYTSLGKPQSYASHFSQYVKQGPTPPPATLPATVHTFGQLNGLPNPNAAPPNVAPAPAYDWLVHLDRQVVSPVELLQVCGYHPHELTHRFVIPDPINVGQFKKFQHVAPWFDQTTRLCRFLELAEAADRSYG